MTKQNFNKKINFQKAVYLYIFIFISTAANL